MQSRRRGHDSLQDPRRRCGILAVVLGLGACSFPDVRYDSAQEDGGATDASVDTSGDASGPDATGVDAQAADAAMATDASSNDGGAPGADAHVDAEAGGGGPPLGSASTFAILAGTTVTNTGQSSFMGDLGVAPGTAVTGITPAMVSGTIHADDAAAIQAEQALLVAYDDLRRTVCTTTLPGSDLGTLTLGPGVYCFATPAASLTGTLILDAGGDPSAVFVFQIDQAFMMAASGHVQVINDASACNVFWQVGASATIGAASTFAGTILALTSITVSAGVLLDGRALAENGAVTVDTSVVSVGGCP